VVEPDSAEPSLLELRAWLLLMTAARSAVEPDSAEPSLLELRAWLLLMTAVRLVVEPDSAELSLPVRLRRRFGNAIRIVSRQ